MWFDWHYFTKKRVQRQAQKGDLPAWLGDYIRHNENKNLHKPIEESRFVVFDTETTGLDPQKDYILSIGAVALYQNKIEVADSLEIFLKNESTGNQESIAIHQILPQETRSGCSETEALAEFISFIRGDVLVAHLASFDVQMVSKTLKNFCHLPLLNPFLDTIHLAKRLDGISSWDETIRGGEYTLDRLCEQYQIEFATRHNAAADALATAELLQVLLQKAHRRGIKTLADLLH
ncbi:MAG: 3'-5' exonuclease [Microscillaceae bacterium]|jgi:DNA polymerase-3 subunit epsilon|nr:3'-5' exonuclease [Microscillaceae bacterium]